MDPNSSDQQPPLNPGYMLPSRKDKVVQPLASSTTAADANGNLAVEVIRSKLDRLYANEPDATEEQAEVKTEITRSKHQQYMYDLSRSGKPLAQIQTEWHEYYARLPEHEKHEVWQEFYAAHAQAKQLATQKTEARTLPTEIQTPTATLTPNEPAKPVVGTIEPAPEKPTTETKSNIKTVSEIRTELLGTVQKRSKLSRKQHFHSLLFGLATGTCVIVIMLFGFFNERFIAPFMTPSRNVSADSIILDPNNPTVGSTPEIIIPKINVEIPVVYDVSTIEEPAVEEGLQRGVVHYATTPLPGQLGNGVIFGHSANNILNKGQYKFAFVLLHKLVVGDTFYINYNGTQYAYKVFDRKIVPPTDVSVLNASNKPATFTLITCDPPGTSINRLVLTGEQISPNPSADTASTVNQDAAAKPTTLPSNAPTLWSRILKSIGL